MEKTKMTELEEMIIKECKKLKKDKQDYILNVILQLIAQQDEQQSLDFQERDYEHSQ